MQCMHGLVPRCLPEPSPAVLQDAAPLLPGVVAAPFAHGWQVCASAFAAASRPAAQEGAAEKLPAGHSSIGRSASRSNTLSCLAVASACSWSKVKSKEPCLSCRPWPGLGRQSAAATCLAGSLRVERPNLQNVLWRQEQQQQKCDAQLTTVCPASNEVAASVCLPMCTEALLVVGAGNKWQSQLTQMA